MDSGNSWDRFGGGREMQQQRSEPRSQSPRFERSEPIRINPPIVRERSQPRFEGGGNSGRMSGGGGSARMSGGEARGGGGGGAARSEGRGANRDNGGGGRGRNR